MGDVVRFPPRDEDPGYRRFAAPVEHLASANESLGVGPHVPVVSAALGHLMLTTLEMEDDSSAREFAEYCLKSRASTTLKCRQTLDSESLAAISSCIGPDTSTDLPGWKLGI